MTILKVLCTFITLMLFSASCHAQTREATMIFASDMPVIGNATLGDYPELGSLLAELRKQNDITFFAFGGGSIGPSPMSGFDRGSHIIDILNSLEPDLMSVTKREFSYFEDELSLRSYEAAFPIIASNIQDTMLNDNLNGLVDSVIIEKGGLKLGFLSVLDDTVIKEYLLQRIRVLDPRSAIEQGAQALRKQGADFVVLMYSSAFTFIDELLNKQVIDLSLLTDVHLELTLNRKTPTHKNSVFVTKPGQVAIIELSAEAGKNSSLEVSWHSEDLINFKKAPVIELQVQQYMLRLNRLLNEKIGQLDSEVNTTRQAVRGQESAFGNFIADTMREFFKADIGLINGGVIRGEKLYKPGEKLTRRDIAIELPFRSRIVAIEVKGSQLSAAIENGLSQVEDNKGRFPQVSGLNLVYDPKAPAGTRIVSLTVQGRPFDESATYRLATSDYLAKGGDGYEALMEGVRLNAGPHVTPLLSDIIINAIRKHKNIAPRIEGRITEVDG